jgi:hypothetical protein
VEDYHFLILWLLSKSIYYGNKNAPSKIVFQYSSKYVKIQSLQHTIIMPKRKVAYTKRSVFYPCGACRQNCTTEVIRCDSCSSWFHYPVKTWPSKTLLPSVGALISNASNTWEMR